MTNNRWMKRDRKRATSEMIMRNTYKQFQIKYYLLVEGEKDEKFFSNIIDCKICKIVDMDGKDNVIDFIKEQNQVHRKGYLGVVDADFGFIDSNVETIDNVLTVDVHDIEMLIMKSIPDMRKIYAEYGDVMTISNFEKGGDNSFFEAVINATYEIGCLKYVAKKPQYSINMKDLPYEDFINDKIEVDISVLIKRIKGKHLEVEIQDEYNVVYNKQYDKWQMGCGHDATSIFALCFCDKESGGLGYGKNRHPMAKERIESALRLVYNYNCFMSTSLYEKICEWQEKMRVCILSTNVFDAA